MRAPRRIRRDLRAMTAEGASYSFMVGAGETYFAAFLLALGHGSVAAGLIATLPMVAGGLLQLSAPRITRWLGSYRAWIILCAVAQGFAFGPFVAAALGAHVSLVGLYLAASVYWAAGMATSSSWNTWSDSLVPDQVKATYFAGRARVCQFFVLVGLMAAGNYLITAETGHATRAFAVLFAAAAVARWISAASFALPRRSAARPHAATNVTVGELLRRFRHSDDGRLLLYMLTVQAAASMVTPFFTPFMLNSLELSYSAYALLLATAFVGRITILPAWGALARRYSATTLLVIGGVGIVPMSLVWVVSDALPYLIVMQFFGGAMWGAWELATALMMFSHIREEERIGLLTLYNLCQALAIAVGSAVGATLFFLMGPGRATYFTLFALSCTARMLTLAFLRRISTLEAPPVELILRITAVRPVAGAILRPIMATLRAGRPARPGTDDGSPQG